MRTTIELCGVKISISARFKQFDTPAWDNNNYAHPHFRITIKVLNPVRIQRAHIFDYWGSVMDARNDKEELTEKELLDCLCCLFADACMYDANRDFVDFCPVVGYVYLTDYDYAMSAYKGCKQAHTACARLFGKGYGEIHSALEEYLSKMED